MKYCVVFILLLLNSFTPWQTQACSWYPYGEDVRFSLFTPDKFDYADYSSFMYASSLFCSCGQEGRSVGETDPLQEPNVNWWHERSKQQPSKLAVYEAVYGAGDAISDPASSNEFVKWLYENKDQEAIDYLKFAHSISPFNSMDSDNPWERDDDSAGEQRDVLIKSASKKATDVQDEALKKRYAFLGIRLAYYNNDQPAIGQFYKQYFEGEPQNILDYWAMSFYLSTASNAAKKNFAAAQVFSNAPDKRMRMLQYYDRGKPMKQTLALAKTPEQRAAIWLIEGIRKPGRNLEGMRAMRQEQINARGLGVLLLREINKLEDWIFTPNVVYFEPSIQSEPSPDDYYDMTPANQNAFIRQRVARDRIYAKEVLKFVKETDFAKVEDPKLWQLAQAYLSYICEDYPATQQAIKDWRGNSGAQTSIARQWDILEALTLTASQAQGKAFIPEKAQALLLQEHQPKLVLALARILEKKGNTSQAALLFSKVNAHIDQNDENYDWYSQPPTFWRAPNYAKSNGDNIYDGYFFYLDAAYTPAQINLLIEDIVENSKGTSAFQQWLYGTMKDDTPRLYDLMGTKYIRLNKLPEALQAFEKVKPSLWEGEPYRTYLDANPFYTNLFNEHYRTEADTVTFNKLSLTKTLIDYLKRAENEADPNRDYYYFMAANCYLNMTTHGNSWLMRRYYWSGSAYPTGLEDDEEYLGAHLAKQYYLKAEQTSKNNDFAALCLRMAGRCEKYALITNEANRYDIDWENVFRDNKAYQQLREKYPNAAEELLSNCLSFEEYFAQRR